TTYTVGVKDAGADKKVLVTKYNDPLDPGAGTTSAWVDYSELINDAIEGVNGITATLNTTTNKVEVGLGGTLATGTTTIATSTGNTDPADDSKLAITGLADVTSTFQDDADGYVMVMTTNGVLQRTKLTSLVAANNGLTVNDGSVIAADKGKVQLGGDLERKSAV